MSKYKIIEKDLDKEYNNYIHKESIFYYGHDYSYNFYYGYDYWEERKEDYYYVELSYEYAVSSLYYVTIHGFKVPQHRLTYKKVDILKSMPLLQRRNLILDEILKEEEKDVHYWGTENIEIDKKYILKNWNVVVLVIEKSKNKSFIRLYEDINSGGFWIDNKELIVNYDRNI